MPILGLDEQPDGQGNTNGRDADPQYGFIDAAKQENAELAASNGGDGNVKNGLPGDMRFKEKNAHR